MRPRLVAVSTVAGVRAEPTIDPASPARRAAKLIDEPMSPIPIRAMRSNMGFFIAPPCP
jgi:hypothetical protein